MSVHDIQKAASKLQRLARRIIVNRMVHSFVRAPCITPNWAWVAPITSPLHALCQIREVQSAIDNEVKFVEGLVSSIQCAWRRCVADAT